MVKMFVEKDFRWPDKSSETSKQASRHLAAKGPDEGSKRSDEEVKLIIIIYF